MAQAARERRALAIAPRPMKPVLFNGTDAAWRVLCDLYPTAETPEIIMAIVEYCAAKRLDPFKRPVHIVPMYNAKAGRRVQTVMRGINEIETVAARTGKWAGMDRPEWGPEVERTFRGSSENDDGSTTATQITLRYPEWCAVTVYRMVGGERRAFTEQLFWDETYTTAAFRSELPNDRWQKARRQMLHKCTKAAVLRTAFPEEDLGYSAEEMEDRIIEAGGVTIEGVVDRGDPGMTERDRRPAAPGLTRGQPPEPPRTGLALLEEDNGTVWLRNLRTLLAGAASEDEVVEIGGHPRVRASIETAPTLIVDQINTMLREAHARVRPAPPASGEWEPPPRDEWPDDPIAEHLAEVEAADLDGLDAMTASAAWHARVNDMFPPDVDRLREAIDLRRAILKGQGA
jgi:phage recombination protein Bet